MTACLRGHGSEKYLEQVVPLLGLLHTSPHVEEADITDCSPLAVAVRATRVLSIARHS